MQEQTDIQPQAKSIRQTKTARIECRATDDQKQELMAKAAAHGLDLSEYLLAAGSGCKMPPGNSDRQLLVQLLGELGKSGSNINQIAKAMNQGDSPALPAIIRATESHERLCDQIYSILSNGKL